MGKIWGRQIAVAMTGKDEEAFLSFLQSTADIQILVSPAETLEGLSISELTPRKTGRMQFFIWNKKFAWAPDVAPTTAGSFYVRDIGRAPVLEYGRDPLRLGSGDQGRLYWSKGLTVGGQYEHKQYPYSYDAQEFEKWYELVVSWIKTNSKRKDSGKLPVYYLPGAWRWHGWYAP